MRLRQLTGLMQDQLHAEYEEVMKQIAYYEEILSNDELCRKVITDELIEVKAKYGDKRRSEIVYSSEEFNPEDFYADDEMIITISHMGYIKRTPLSEFRAQNRGGVGSKGTDTRDADFIEHIYPATMHNTMMFFTQKGKCYWLKVYEIPEGTKNSKGRAIQNLLNIDSDDAVNAYLRVKNLSDQDFINSHYVFFCTKNGVIKKTLLEQYSRPRQNGVNAITIREDDRVIEVRMTNGDNEIIIANRNGRAIRFHENAVRVIIPRQQNTEYELYKKLWQVEGIQSFSTCYLMKDSEPLTDFSGGFSLKIPKKERELKVCIHCGSFTEKVDMERFREYLKTFYYTGNRTREQNNGQKEYDWGVPESTYRNVFSHIPIAGEFPACYHLSPNRDREMLTSFEAYLKLYDKMIEDGLKEVEDLPYLLSLFAEDFAVLMEKSDRKRDILALKSRYLDFLDRLYGVESHPAWLSEQNSYGETKEGTLLRRMNFLRHIAGLIKNRARARNIIVPGGEGNVSTVKEWFCRLLGINESDEHTVSNVLPSYNLQLIEKKPDKPLFDRIDSLLIDDRMLEADNVLEVDYEELSADEAEKRKEYKWMRQELQIFNENRISGDLFRGGTRLDNYRIVKAGKDEYMLVFHNRERGGWTNLGRADSREQLNTLANILRRSLRDLNRECETIYVVEPVLTDPEGPFHLLLVLPIWTQRFHTPRFREKCGELLRSIIPAHLTGTIYWLDERAMRKFEGCYRQLMRTLCNSELQDYGKQLLDAMYELLKMAIEIQELDGKY